MKISKHQHSCLLVQEAGITYLFDPGIFTYQEKALDIVGLSKLDYILITHEHPDHMHIPLIKDLLAKFPDVTIISNPSVAKVLSEENMHVHTDLSDIPAKTDIQIEEVAHETVWDMEVPQNILIHVAGKITNPGDSHHFDNTREVLALPLTAPWGSTTEAVELALRLKPKYIIPIHDWMWKDGIRKAMYERLTGFFAKHDIIFKALETGEVTEL